jgi:hypothetical protein
MSTKDRQLLRPEDATSLEEFQARRMVEQAQIRALNSSWKDIGRILLSSLIVIIDIFFWYAMVKQAGPGRWVWLVLALLFAFLFLRIFGKVELRGVRGSKRYMQLDRLSKEWQAKAGRGEIPQSTPGWPKVWRDQLGEASTRGA